MTKRKSWRCHDCGCQEGQFHRDGCDMEVCPFCGGQSLICGCIDKYMKLDYSSSGVCVLSPEQSEQWHQILNQRGGRIPYLLIPNLCCLCGEQWPETFTVPDDEWRKYVIPQLRKEMLCLDCYNELKKIFPNGWRKGKVG